MKMLKACPRCKGPLLNEYVQTRGLKTLLKLSCTKSLGHYFVMKSFVDDHDRPQSMTLGVGDRSHMTLAIWYLDNKKLLITPFISVHGDIDELPYVEPDLSDYDKLVNKVRTYILFS